MYAKNNQPKFLKNGQPIRYMCQSCYEIFGSWTGHNFCPHCFMNEKGNLIVLYIENDLEQTECLDLIDFTAG